jgi:hypothetical protein
MRLLIGLVCATAAALLITLSLSFAQSGDSDDDSQGCPDQQMRDPNTGNCVAGTVQPPNYTPGPGETCGQWCMCESGERPGADSCAPCQTSSSLICYPFTTR